MSENVETKGKIVDSEEFLAEFERVFGKNAEYFMAAAAMRTTPETKMLAGMPGNPSSVADGDSSSSEELIHRAEVFERMAFRLKEERDLLVWLVGKGFNDANFVECDACANLEIFAKCRGGECKSCKEKCYCGFCRNGSGFVLDLERAKKLKEKLPSSTADAVPLPPREG